MKILPLNSKLRYPIETMDPRQIVFFNAIRYSCDICEISYNRLVNNLSVLTQKKGINSDDFPNVYSDIWSIINNAAIFKKMITSEFHPIPVNTNFSEIIKAINLRDSYQHLDERLDEIHLNEFPAYGSISWVKKLLPSNKSIISVTYSGTFTNKQKINTAFTNENMDELNEEIQKIELTGIIRVGRKPKFTYRKEAVYINKIIQEMILWVTHLDNLINEKFIESDIESHSSDLLLQLLAMEISTDIPKD